MNNVAIMGTCANLSPKTKKGKKHMRSLQRHQRCISTTDFHSISDESECSWMIQILDMLWYSSMNPNWYQKGQKQVVGTSLENDFVNSFKTMMCCFQKEMLSGYHFFSIFTHVASLELGDPLTQLHTNAREILPRCSKENSTVEVWQKRGSAMFW